jgi:hypothetical protein
MNLRRYGSFHINIIVVSAVVILSACSESPSTSSKLVKTPTLSDALNEAFSRSAYEYKVPRVLLLAIGYVESQWQTNLPGSEGIMGLYSNGRKDSLLSRAAFLTGETKEALINDPATNIRGAAAVLAADGGGALDSDLGAWYGAVIRYIGLPYKEPTGWFADYVYSILAKGIEGKTDTGEKLVIPPQKVNPNIVALDDMNLPELQKGKGDYPEAGAFFDLLYGIEPEGGNDIRYIVIHDTEVNYSDTLRIFNDPNVCCSAHYIVDGENGKTYPDVTQLIRHQSIVHHSGNAYYNSHSIGIEHIGFAAYPNGFYTSQMYDSSARLVAYLCWYYHIPLDRAHIIGHDTVPAAGPDRVRSMHWDPGPFWDWPYYLGRIQVYYAQWSGNTAPASAPLDKKYLTPRASIRTITAGANRSEIKDIPYWSAGQVTNFTSVYRDDNGKPGKELILSASDPNIWSNQKQLDVAFACDNDPSEKITDITNLHQTASDLRAKASYNDAYVDRATYKASDGTNWTQIAFNGTIGWVQTDATTNGWGAIITFSRGTKMYGMPQGDQICPDGANGSSRAGQSYVAHDKATDDKNNVWYAIYYNHRLAWVPESEVSVS